MKDIAKIYTNDIKKHFKVLYANWEPSGPINIGDYGVLDGNIFIPKGNLSNDFQEFTTGVIQLILDETASHLEYKSGKEVLVKFVGKGEISSSGIPAIKASMEVFFSKNNSIFFNAAGCKTNRIKNKKQVGEILIDLFLKEKWNKDYLVVTDLVNSENTTIAISTTNESLISFEAESPLIEQIKLGDASVKLSATTQRNIGYKLESASGLNLLFSLCKVEKKILGDPEWGAKGFSQNEYAFIELK